jgi:hypothetical protein
MSDFLGWKNALRLAGTAPEPAEPVTQAGLAAGGMTEPGGGAEPAMAEATRLAEQAASQLETLAPELHRLQGERRELESRLRALTGEAAVAQPHGRQWPVATLRERIAEQRVWDTERTQQRDRRAVQRPASGSLSTGSPSAAGSALPRSERPEPVVRTGATPVSAATWLQRRDRMPRDEPTVGTARAPDPAPLAWDRRRSSDADASPARPQKDRRLDVGPLQDLVRQDLREALKRKAREKTAAAWKERVRRAVPEDTTRDRALSRALQVDVGSLDDLAQRLDHMRDQAKEARDAAELALSRDQARRDRALENLRARRAQEIGSAARLSGRRGDADRLDA